MLLALRVYDTSEQKHYEASQYEHRWTKPGEAEY